MASGQSFAGVERPGAAELHFANQLLWEREEAKANSTRAKSRPGKGPSGSLHGRRPWNSPASADRALGDPVLLGKWMRRERGRRGSSPQREAGQRRLRTTDFARRVAAKLRRRQLRAAGEKRRRGEGENGGGSARASGCSPLEAEARGSESRSERGSGASAWRFLQQRKGRWRRRLEGGRG